MSFTFSNEENFDNPALRYPAGGEGLLPALTSTSAPNDGSVAEMDYRSIFGIDVPSTALDHSVPAPAPSGNFATRQNDSGAPFARSAMQNPQSTGMRAPHTYPRWGQQQQRMVNFPNFPIFVGLTFPNLFRIWICPQWAYLYLA
jgi:hypothetical protein